MSPSAHHVNLHHVANLRNTPAALLPALTDDALRLHIERLAPECVADLFALAELPLPGALSADLKNWAARASREMLDLPAKSRLAFVGAVAELPAGQVPARMREAIVALAPGSTPEVGALIEQLAGVWTDREPEPVVLPVKKAAPPQTTAGGAPIARAVAGAPKTRVARTPASQVDPRRGESVRFEALETLPRYERGLKESVFLAGIKHRSTFKDLTDAEVLTELRRMERERKVKKTGERWMMR